MMLQQLYTATYSRIAIIVFLFTIVCNTAFSQNRYTDTSATLIAFWKVGDEKKINITHSKEKLLNDISKGKSTGTYEANLKIIDSTANSFTIEWRYSNFAVSGVPDSSLTQFNGVLDNMKIVYTTDELGSFKELINWKEIKDSAFSKLNNSVKTLGGKSLDKKTTDLIKSFFQTRESVETYLIKEIQLFHSLYGIEFTTNGTKVETELPNMTGGQPFPGHITIKLEKVDPAKDQCKVSFVQEIDKSKAGNIILDFLEKISGEPLKATTKEKKEVMNMDIKDISECDYSIESGWVSRFLYARTVNVTDTKQIDTYIITEKK